jgi:hypothetical protein
VKGDHQRIILAKLGSNLPCSFRGKKVKFHPPFLFLATVAPIGTKLCMGSPWMIPFQICVRQSKPPTNMATVAKNKKGG